MPVRPLTDHPSRTGPRARRIAIWVANPGRGTRAQIVTSGREPMPAAAPSNHPLDPKTVGSQTNRGES